MLLNIGPSHPAMHGCFRVLVELDGERISRAVPEIGYMHRCFEKEVESHPWNAAILYADRLNYVSPILNEVGYCLAVEKLMGVRAPERAQWIRMLAGEVSRICDHLVSIGVNLVDAGALTNYWYLMNARERFVDWLEALTGARLTANYVRVGGVARDLPAGTERALAACLKDLRRAMREVRALVRGNRIFLERTRGVAAIGSEEAVECGFTGPALRAAGCAYDVRKDEPYLRYAELDWDVPVGSGGDVYDRIFVRFEEIAQSARMVEQILARMPGGAVMAGDWAVAMPGKHEVYGTMEGMIRHFKLATEGMRVPAGETYACTEAANGELGFYVVSDGSARPYRVKVRPPCFPLFQAFPRLIEGHMVSDAVVTLASLNIIAGELDR